CRRRAVVRGCQDPGIAQARDRRHASRRLRHRMRAQRAPRSRHRGRQMKLPAPSVYWIDTAGIAVIALMTAGLYYTMIGPALDLRAREDELNTRLGAMRSNLTALRTR